MSDSCNPMDCSPPGPSLRPWDLPGKNTGVGYHFLLQGIFRTQKLKPGLLHCRQILYWLSYKGSCVYKYMHIHGHINDLEEYTQNLINTGRKERKGEGYFHILLYTMSYFNFFPKSINLPFGQTSAKMFYCVTSKSLKYQRTPLLKYELYMRWLSHVPCHSWNFWDQLKLDQSWMLLLSENVLTSCLPLPVRYIQTA